jgi:hypothetical protein
MVFPLCFTYPFLARFLGRDVSFWAVLSNAAAHGKRLCAIDASRAKKAVWPGGIAAYVRGAAAVF